MTPRNANSGLVESLGVLRNQGMTCLLTGSISLPILWTGECGAAGVGVGDGCVCVRFAVGNSFLWK